MGKESYQTPHMDDYNKRHYSRIEQGTWFSEFYPFTIYKGDIPRDIARFLVEKLKEYETDSQEMFETNVRSAFEDFLLSYVDEELLEYLPQKPEPVDWASLPLEKKNEVMKIFDECREQGLTKKTIKKKIRKALES
jgi:hypothetical protein